MLPQHVADDLDAQRAHPLRVFGHDLRRAVVGYPPSSQRGSPALDCAINTTPSGRACAISHMIRSISAGPFAAVGADDVMPHSLKVCTACAGVTPIMVRKLVSKVMVTTTGRSHMPAAPSTAACTSSSELHGLDQG